MEGNARYSTVATLQPFVHQVGGHSSIQQFDQYTVCKPLFSKELQFYQDACPLFEPFIPKFKGVVSVRNVEENGDNVCQVVSSSENMNLYTCIYRYGKHCSSCTCLQKRAKEKYQHERSDDFIKKTDGSTALDSCRDNGLDDSSLEYILLENVVGHYKCPCILDLKMGTEKHKDYITSKEEADRRQARWDQTTSRSLGARVCGMKVYLVTEEKFLVMNHGRELTIEGFTDAIKTFLFNGRESRYDVIEPYLEQLGKLLNIMERQSSYRFYNTSLLLIYEGEVSATERVGHCQGTEVDAEMESTNQKGSSLANVCVRMIDFAHVHYNKNKNSEIRSRVDESYLVGLRSVIRILNEILEELRRKPS